MNKLQKSLTKVVSRTVANVDKAITLETANLARFADGACTCSLGDTSVLVTAVSQQSSKTALQSFVPLSVDYRQKAAAAGRIPMTHLRRDIGVTEGEMLTSRMIDRSIRPAFPKGFINETQIICNLLAVDGINDPDVLAINGASTSLALSDIPWNGPIGAVRMGLIDEIPVVNPTRHEAMNSRLNLVLSANKVGNIMMMDGSAKEPILMPDILKVIKYGLKECRSIIDSILKLQASCGKPKRLLDLSFLPNEEQLELVTKFCQERLKIEFQNYSHDKISRDEAVKLIQTEAKEAFKAKFPETDASTFYQAFSDLVKMTYRQLLNETQVRCDGRLFDEIRPIDCKVDLYKPLHGSSLFQRGQTQVFCSTTFDSPDAAFRTDPTTLLVSGIKEKNFMLHYEFPKFATNEVGKVSAMPGRREIGHGALAEKSIRPVVPDEHDMTIRLNCEVLESNGSSSMASVCAGSMSLMDAGVKIKEHVAGVAMGLMSDLVNDSTNKPSTDGPEPIILTDILGFEDYIGDMDLKIAGTKRAITAIQLDVKPMYGLPATTIYQAINKAHIARGEIISKMDKAIKEPRKLRKDNHPIIKTIHVPAHKRAKFIGFGGSNLKRLSAQIGVRISACAADDGSGDTLGAAVEDNYTIFAPNKDAMQEAEEYIKTLLEKDYREPELEFNGIYTATITEVRQSGVMVSLYPNMNPTLLPLSQLDIKYVNHPSALNLKVGQQIQVKYFGRDPATGQMRLSRKSLLMSGISKIHRTPV